MTKKILVPIDFTQKSVAALQMAKTIQTAYESEIHVAHVIPAALSATLTETGKYMGKTERSQKFIDDIYTEREKLLFKFMESQGFSIDD